MGVLTDLNDDIFLSVNDFARDTSWLHSTAVFFAHYGVVLFAAALAFAAWQSRRGSAQSLAAAMWTGAGALLALALNQPLGRAIHEGRPYTAHQHALLLVSRTSDFSFPSDHAVMAGAVAAGLLLVTPRHWWVAGLAVLMACDRVYVGAHYPGDVVAGLAFGAGIVVLGWWALQRPLVAVAERARAGRMRPLLVSDRPAQTASSSKGVSVAG